MRRLFLLAISLLLAADSFAQKKRGKKGEEEPTQTLPALPDPPGAVTAETARLEFQVSTLSGRGLLSRQTRDAVDELFRKHRGAQIVHLRAFVAGTGDLRRVTAIVAEEFAAKKLPLPALSLIQVGALPVEGAQVVLESVAVARKPLNPQGVAWFAGVAESSPAASVARLKRNADAARAAVLRVTCLLSTLEFAAPAQSAVAGAFPGAALTMVQLQRLPGEPLCECEAVARLGQAPTGKAELVPETETYARAALVNSPRVVLTGSQMAFGDQEKDVRLLFERLGKALESQKAAFRDVVFYRAYPLTSGVRGAMRQLRFDYLDRARPPASTVLLFEGLPSLDATAAVDLVAAVE